MKILLAESHFSYEKTIIKGERYFPLGLGYIASYIRRGTGRKVELFLSGISEFEKKVMDNPPEVLGVSCMTNTYPVGVQMARIAKRYNPKCMVIFGGQHPSSVRGEILIDNPEVDFVAVGEGEVLMDKFLSEIESGRYRWQEVQGLIYRTPEGIQENLPSCFIDNIEELPFPARDLADNTFFNRCHPHMRFGGRTASIITSRGCPWNCTYCSSNVTMGRKYRFLTADYVLGEIEELYHKYKINNLIIWDDVFTFNQERVDEICNKLITRKIKINWFCQSRTDTITSDLAPAMKKAGCKMISFGIESGNEKTLERIRKKVSLETVLKSIHYCKKVGIRTQGTFILGFPHETREEMNDTIKFSLKSNLDIALFFSFTPYPGTYEWQFVPLELKPKNVNDWEAFICNNRFGRTWNRNLNDTQMRKVILNAHLKFYFRPVQFYRILKSVSNFRELFSYVQVAFNLFCSILKMLYYKNSVTL